MIRRGGTPVYVERPLGDFRPSRIAPVKNRLIEPKVIGSGELTETFGYPGDNPGASFYLRNLVADKHPAQGVWRRYDLGRIRFVAACDGAGPAGRCGCRNRLQRVVDRRTGLTVGYSLGRRFL